MLFQWGFVSTTLPLISNGTVTFQTRGAGAIPFPTNCFIVNATISTTSPPTGSAEGVIAIGTITKTSFNYTYANILNTRNGFYWFAIGN